MKIGINARYLKNAHSGIANYLLNLILNLKKKDQKNKYVLFFGSEKSIPEPVLNSGFDFNISRMPTHNQALKIIWSHLYLPYAIKREQIDLFHEPSLIAPLIKTCPTIITIYDLAYLHIPECYTRRTRIYFNSLLSNNIRRADSIITISESSKKDILANFTLKPEKIKVIYAGLDEIFRPIGDREEQGKVKDIYKIKKDFILAVSGITPRKNIRRLIRAFKLLRNRERIDFQLVVVGEKSWRHEETFREVALCGLGDNVIFCGYIPKWHLVCLYNAAAVFVHPSLYEGFGLPVLEAMACGCPVVASDSSSMPEVCGNAALLVDPKSIEALSSAMYKLIADASLRENLIKNGFERIKKFSWEKAAKETQAVYNSIA